VGVLGTLCREEGQLSRPWRMSVPDPSAGGVSLGSCDWGARGARGPLTASTNTNSPWQLLGHRTDFLGLWWVGRDPPSSHAVPPTQGTGLSAQPCAGSPIPLSPRRTKGCSRSPPQRETEARHVPEGQPQTSQDTGDHRARCCPPALQSSEPLLEGPRQPGLFLGAP